MPPESSPSLSRAVDVLLQNPYESTDYELFQAQQLLSEKWSRLPEEVALAARAGRGRDAEKMLYAAAHAAVRDAEAVVEPVLDIPRKLTDLLTATKGETVPEGDVRRVACALSRFYAELAHFAGTSAATTQVRALAWRACFGASVHGALRSQERMFEQHVLLLGETGTGKELVANAIQAGMVGAADESAPSQTINAAAMTPELANSDLFGHERGAFTGAVSQRRGRILDADGGTLFFDEVADLPLVTQGALLRVISSGVVVPVGTNRELPVRVRYIAATSKPLDEMVERKEFVLDLYQRLARQVIRIPPLRERPADIADIGNSVLREKGLAPEQLDARVRGRELDEAAMRQLTTHEALGLRRSSEWLANEARKYSWPGNVRELRSCIINLLEGFAPPTSPSTLPSASTDVKDVMLRRILDCAVTEDELVDWYFQRVLDAVKKNQTEAERILGKNRSTVHRRLKRLGLDNG